jgi:predicted nucleic acid-binding protein
LNKYDERLMKRNAALDASFWINGYRSGILDFLLSYFTVFVPSVVVEEIEHPSRVTGLLTPAGQLFQQWRLMEKVVVQDPEQPVDWFQPGENAAIGLALERGYRLLIDDRAPYHLAKARSLRAISTADFILLLYTQGQLDYDEAQAKLSTLRISEHIRRVVMHSLGRLATKRGERP